MTHSPHAPALAVGINNAKAIACALRLGLPVSHTARALNQAQTNGPTLFWTVAKFHQVEIGLARQIVEKHTSTAGTDWRAALAELEYHIVPF